MEWAARSVKKKTALNTECKVHNLRNLRVIKNMSSQISDQLSWQIGITWAIVIVFTLFNVVGGLLLTRNVTSILSYTPYLLIVAGVSLGIYTQLSFENAKDLADGLQPRHSTDVIRGWIIAAGTTFGFVLLYFLFLVFVARNTPLNTVRRLRALREGVEDAFETASNL